MARKQGDVRVVVTGMGVCSALGFTEERFRARISEVPPPANRSVVDAELEAELDKYVPQNDRRRMNRLTKLGVHAAMVCVRSLGIEVSDTERDHYGGIFSSCFGPVASARDFVKSSLPKGPHTASPLIFPYTVGNATPGVITTMLGWRGVSSTVSGYNPIIYAFDLFLGHRAKGILAGGIEELTPEMRAYCASRHAADGRPLPPLADVTEGAAMIMLETHAAASARGARPVLELLGTGTAFNMADDTAADGMGPVDPGSVHQSMVTALEDAGVEPSRVGTVLSLARDDNEQVDSELGALKRLFGAELPRLYYPKRVIGESFGASELFSLAFAFCLAKGGTPDAARPAMVINGCQAGGSLSSIVVTPAP